MSFKLSRPLLRIQPIESQERKRITLPYVRLVTHLRWVTIPLAVVLTVGISFVSYMEGIEAIEGIEILAAFLICGLVIYPSLSRE